MAVLIIAEHDHQHLHPATLTAITAATQLSKEIMVWVIGHECASVAEQAAYVTGVTSVWLTNHAVYAAQLPENVAELIASQANDFSHILAASTTFGKNLIPRIAALIDVAPISDVTNIVTPDTFTRPIYAGNIFITQQSLDKTKIFTVRPTAFTPARLADSAVTVQKVDNIIENTQSRWISTEHAQSERPDLGVARVVISGGRGLQSAENFKLLAKIADHLNAALGASRAAVDAGFAPNEWQVGQTGRVVAPELYIAVGISGAIQHVAGMKDSKVIVAINKDADAPIFDIADYGLVGDLFEILPALEEALTLRPATSSRA